jgi:hypothetical protein
MNTLTTKEDQMKKQTIKPAPDSRTPEQIEMDRQANATAAIAKAETLIATPATRKNRISFEDICTLRAALAVQNIGDSRMDLLYRLQQEFESVEQDLASHIWNMQSESDRIVEFGIAAVHDALAHDSRLENMAAAAAKVHIMRTLLNSVIRKLDDPCANIIDRFVHARLNG